MLYSLIENMKRLSFLHEYLVFRQFSLIVATRDALCCQNITP